MSSMDDLEPWGPGWGLRPVAYTIQEGGSWFPWPYLTLDDYIHAIKFEDGRIIDVINGLRKNSVPQEE